MLSRIFFLLFFVILSSCSLFRTQSIHDKKIDELINALNGVGEGRGRLGIDQHQYLFSYESILKDEKDWILAASIPLHGEEILVLNNLKEETAEDAQANALEMRIENGIKEHFQGQANASELSQAFLTELRSVMRLVLHKELKVPVICHENQCQQGTAVFQATADSKQLSLKKMITDDYEFEYVAQNLTESIFRRGSIFLHSTKPVKGSRTLLSLELFWN